MDRLCGRKQKVLVDDGKSMKNGFINLLKIKCSVNFLKHSAVCCGQDRVFGLVRKDLRVKNIFGVDISSIGHILGCRRRYSKPLEAQKILETRSDVQLRETSSAQSQHLSD